MKALFKTIIILSLVMFPISCDSLVNILRDCSTNSFGWIKFNNSSNKSHEVFLEGEFKCKLNGWQESDYYEINSWPYSYKVEWKYLGEVDCTQSAFVDTCEKKTMDNLICW